MPGHVWIDVEDLLRYVMHHRRPSGIQRVQFELCRALAALDSVERPIRFVRHGANGTSLVSVPFREVQDAYASLSRADPGQPAAVVVETMAAPVAEPPVLPRSVLYRAARFVYRRLPDGVRYKAGAFYYFQRQAWRSLLARHAPSGEPMEPEGVAGEPEGARPVVAPVVVLEPASAFAREAGPGDVLLVLGSPWFEGHAEAVAHVREAMGLRVALLVHDVIPLRRPEWCDAGLVVQFRRWFHAMVRVTDVVLTVSRATAADVARFLPPGRAVRPTAIPMGSGFSVFGPPVQAVEGRAAGLPAPGSYVLCVATIEVRKNHALLFRVWRRLLDEFPADEVPTLVFAGKVGWLVGDLMAQMRNASFLDGKIVLIQEPSDRDLKALYEGCLFTAFPSLYEGWGLPVTESLIAGRPCVASDRTSLPEAGGDLARYFDPENVGQAYEVIRDVIMAPAALQAWRERVAREFAPVRWETSARAILAATAADVGVGAGLPGG